MISRFLIKLRECLLFMASAALAMPVSFSRGSAACKPEAKFKLDGDTRSVTVEFEMRNIKKGQTAWLEIDIGGAVFQKTELKHSPQLVMVKGTQFITDVYFTITTVKQPDHELGAITKGIVCRDEFRK